MQDQNPLRADFLESAPPNRRAFIKKMAAVAFVVPAVGVFSMNSVALAAPAHSCGNQTFPNQTSKQAFPNQAFPNQTFPNQISKQSFPNQIFPNQITKQSFPNQTFPNQTRSAGHEKGDHKRVDHKRCGD